jgi:DNA-binding CsgD family transcriptional regulator
MAPEPRKPTRGPRSQTTRELLALLSGLETSGPIRTLQAQALRLLLPAFDCQRGQFILASGPDGRLDPDTYMSQGIPAEFDAGFRSRYHQLNPFHPSPRDLGRSAVSGADLMDRRRLTATPYYLEFLKPQSITHTLILMPCSQQRLLAAVYLYRTGRARAFDAADLERGEALAPCLAHSLMIASLHERESGWTSILDAVSDNLPYPGLLVVGPSTELVYANPYARDVLCGSPEAGLSAIPDCVARHCRALLEAGETDGAASLREFRYTASPGGQELAVHLRPLPMGGRTAFVLISLDEIAPVLSLSQELKDLGISSRELDVVLLAYQGLRNAEIGQRLVISEHTVENHLRAIYEKMGVKNRTSLVHRLIEMGHGTSRLIPIQDFPSL